MDILIGLLIIAIGSFCQSSSYVPIKKVKEWSWESFWLVQGVFAWLVFPFLGSLLGIPAGGSLFDLWGAGGAGMSIFYGVLWGIGGLTFGLSMRYLCCAWTKYCIRYLCRIRNPFSCHLRRNQSVRR